MCLKHTLNEFNGLGTQPSVCVCVMESICVNSCPCADPAELQTASLVPTDPSCCLGAERKAITLKQHNTLAVSRRCLFSVLFSFLSIHGCRYHVYSALPAKLHISHLKYTFIFGYNHQLLRFVGQKADNSLFLSVGAAHCVIRQCSCLPLSD